MKAETLAALQEARVKRQAVALATRLDDGAETLIYPTRASGPLANDAAIVAAAHRAMASGRSETVDAGGQKIFVHVYVPPARLIVVGAVHIAQALAPMASLMDFAAKAMVSPIQQSGSPGEVAKVDSQAQVDRVTRLITQEVVTVRQSGANSLAVSLKVDQHTELFLQITNHNGQIQASVRCEHGNASGLDNHWGQLQESLSRQNVQLLPLEEKLSPRASVAPSPDAATSRQFDQSAQNKSRQNRDLPGEFPLPEETDRTVRSRNNKNVSSSPRGWETWA